MNEITKTILPALIEGSATVVAVFIGARMALNTHRSNQWWNARHRTYKKTVAAIEHCMDEVEQYRKRVENGSESEIHAAMAAAKKAYLSIVRIIDGSHFDMSDSARHVLLKVTAEIDDLSAFESSWWDAARKEPDLNKCLWVNYLLKVAVRLFTMEAHADLRIHSLWKRGYERIICWLGDWDSFLRKGWPSWRHKMITCTLIILHGHEKGTRMAPAPPVDQRF